MSIARVLCETKPEDADDEDDDGLRPEDRKQAPAPGGGQCHLPTFTMADVGKHSTPETGIWVTYKDGVYDITEFVEGHPGGADKIMLAAGKSIDAYWNIFQQHFRTGLPLKLLEEMRIGTLAPGEYVVRASTRLFYSLEHAKGRRACSPEGLRPCMKASSLALMRTACIEHP